MMSQISTESIVFCRGRAWHFLTLSALVLACVAGINAQNKEVPKNSLCAGQGQVLTQTNVGSNGGDAWVTTNSQQAGVLAFGLCRIFENGQTNIRRIDEKTLGTLPPELEFDNKAATYFFDEGIKIKGLPHGFHIYQNLIFEVRTGAVTDGAMPVILSVPSVNSPEEFAKLRILYLRQDSLGPGILRFDSFVDRDDKPPVNDFTNRTLTAGIDFIWTFHHRYNVGRFVVASFDEAEARLAPRIDLEVTRAKFSMPLKTDKPFSVTYNVSNKGPDMAREVVFWSRLDSEVQILSVETTQGRCGKDVMSTGDAICRLHDLPATGSISITITGKISRDRFIGGYPSNYKIPDKITLHIQALIGGEGYESELENNNTTRPPMVFTVAKEWR